MGIPGVKSVGPNSLGGSGSGSIFGSPKGRALANVIGEKGGASDTRALVSFSSGVSVGAGGESVEVGLGVFGIFVVATQATAQRPPRERYCFRIVPLFA